jgi:hypothetical protein
MIKALILKMCVNSINNWCQSRDSDEPHIYTLNFQNLIRIDYLHMKIMCRISLIAPICGVSTIQCCLVLIWINQT